MKSKKLPNKKVVSCLIMQKPHVFTNFFIVSLLLCIICAAGLNAQQVPLAGRSFTKYIDPLPHFAGKRVDATTGTQLTVSMNEFQQKVLPSNFVYPSQFTGTMVWGYAITNATGTYGPLYPAFTIETVRNTAVTVNYVNNLPNPPYLQQYLLIDQTLHWADPLMQMGSLQAYVGPPPAVVHLHGAEVPSQYDGGPDQWFTPDGLKGPGYRSLVPTAPNTAVYKYPNNQEGTTLWFHDHTLGATRLNVYAGLAGFYFIRDWDNMPKNLPGGPLDSTVIDNSDPTKPETIKPEIEIVIQDRMFDSNGQLYFPSLGINPEHPFWIPEFFGDTIVVNGKVWPFLNVEPRRYRFHFLDGSNARFYDMQLINQATGASGPVFWQIGTDGGLLDLPVKIAPQGAQPNSLLMAPGERADIIIDFSGFAGQTLLLRNKARAPYPSGTSPDPNTVGQIMQFRVGTTLSSGPDISYNPAQGLPLRIPMQRLNPSPGTVIKRQLTLNEIAGAGGPLEIFVNNSKWNGKRPDGTPIPGSVVDNIGTNYITEFPKVGSTEIWEIINLTMDAHPIHLHLVQFQLLSRQNFNVNKYNKAYNAAFPGGIMIPAYGPPLSYTTPNNDNAIGGNPAVAPYLQDGVAAPLVNERGWKDTVIMHPGEVTRIAVRFARQDYQPGTDAFSFDPTTGPGYVWHCHIIDHEDNEMMRPYNLHY